jgi:flavin reductase (DIM6/NTAB) family NADH-FMN oxidoreductase RutF
MPAETISPPLVAGCFANLECRAIDTRLVNRFNLFVLEATRAWIDPRRRDAKTIHHQGYGQFLVDGKTLTLPSAMP